MPFHIIKNGYAWVLNENGEVMIRNSDDDSIVWLPHNQIQFNDSHEPYIKNINIPLYFEDNSEEAASGSLNNAQSKSQTSEPTKAKCLWEHNETVALIAAVECRYEDLHHPIKKKHIWSIVSEVLSGQGIYYTDDQCKKKWANLLRTYKDAKDKKNSSGRGPTRFVYYDRLDELLGDKPNNSSPHSIDVSTISRVQNTEEDSPSSDVAQLNQTNNEQQKRKRQNGSSQYIQLKKEYGAKIIKIKEKRLELYAKKLELDTRKVKALEALVKMTKKAT